jgi:hypothetical protein
MIETTDDVNETAEKARALYAEIVRPNLTEADKGKYIILNTRTGEWIMDKDELEVERIALERFGVGSFKYLIRAGYRAVHSFRPGVKLELDEW